MAIGSHSDDQQSTQPLLSPGSNYRIQVTSAQEDISHSITTGRVIRII